MGKKLSYPRLYFELLCTGFSLILGMGLTSAFLPILAWELDPTGVLVGGVTSAWFLVRIFTELPSGFLSDRIGRRRLAVIGLVLSTGGTVTCATSHSVHQLIIGRALWGLGAGFYYTNNMALMFDMFEPNMRGKAVGTFQAIEFLGSFVGAPLGAFAAALLGYYAVFYAASLMTLFSLSVVFLSRGLKKEAGRQRSLRRTIPMREALKGLRNWILVVVCSVVMARMLVMQGVMSTVFQLYLNQVLSYEVATIGSIMSMRTVGFCAAVFVAGRLADRLGGKRVIVGGLLVEGICLYLYTTTDSLISIIMVGLLEGIGGGTVSVSLMILLSEAAASGMRGPTVGLYRTFMSLGGILGPIIFTFLYEYSGTIMPFQVAAFLLVAQIPLVLSTQSIGVSEMNSE